MEIKTKYGLGCVNKLKNLHVYTVRLSASAALCAVMAGCVSSDPAALGLADQAANQPLATPQLAVVAGDPSLADTEAQSADPNALGSPDLTQSVIQTANTPQLSPIKRQAGPATSADASTQLAIANPSTSVDPAVKQVANIAEGAVSTPEQEIAAQNVLANGDATVEQPALIAAIQPAPEEIKKPSLLERLFGNRAKKEPAPVSQPVLATVQQPAINASDTTGQAITTAADSVTTEPDQTNEAAAPVAVDQGSAPETTETAVSVEGATAAQPTVVAALPTNPPATKEPNILQRLFGNNKAGTVSRSSNIDERFASAPSSSRGDDDVGRGNLRKRFVGTKPKKTSKIKTISRDANGEIRPQNTASRSALPGVKSNNEIFGIEESPQVKENQANTQLAALGNLGRLSPNGLRLQHDKVQVACLKPGVLQILKIVERKYGKKPIVTSGYRSPKRNRRAGGARNSQHVFCKAVDIQVEGVSKWQLAKYLRSIPGRGGVGTYCRTKSVHVDIGKKRDWHHPCRRSSKRKRKKA